MNAFDKMKKARSVLVLERPFFGTLALRLALVEVSWTDTMCVDGVSLFFNPAFVDSLSAIELKACVAHEVMHCALGHPWRRRHRDIDQWNNAADYVINDHLKKAGFALPEGALLDDRFADMSTEAVYDALQQPEPPSSDDDSDDSSSDDDDASDGQSDDDQQDDQRGDDQSDSDGDDQSDDSAEDAQGDGQGDDDSNADSQQSPDGRPVPSDSTGMGGVIDAPPSEQHSEPTEADYREQQQEWKQAVAQAAQAERVAGDMGADLQRMIDEEMQPRADWRALLREFIEQNARDDYAWNPPNRRFIHQGVYLPSVRSENMPPIVVAIDTSGSVSDTALAMFESELNSILEDMKPEFVNVIYCDATVNHSSEIEPGDFPIKLEAVGGGGTRFQPVFDHVEAEQIEPCALIYFTDMGCFDEPSDPGYPVLWADYLDCVTEEMEFGERIIIN